MRMARTSKERKGSKFSSIRGEVAPGSRKVLGKSRLRLGTQWKVSRNISSTVTHKLT
jgi:hypothetical protein